MTIVIVGISTFASSTPHHQAIRGYKLFIFIWITSFVGVPTNASDIHDGYPRTHQNHSPKRFWYFDRLGPTPTNGLNHFVRILRP